MKYGQRLDDVIADPERAEDRRSVLAHGPSQNDVGSVDVYCGPKAPAGFGKNWIPTGAGEKRFGYLRFYRPTEPYFDRSWPPPDFERRDALFLLWPQCDLHVPLRVQIEPRRVADRFRRELIEERARVEDLRDVLARCVLQCKLVDQIAILLKVRFEVAQKSQARFGDLELG